MFIIIIVVIHQFLRSLNLLVSSYNVSRFDKNSIDSIGASVLYATLFTLKSGTFISIH